MARAGDELVNPVTGHRLVFRRTAGDTDGGAVEVEASYPPGSRPPPDHVHPAQAERHEVLDGELVVRVGGEERVLRAGEVLSIPAGTPHAMWNAGEGAARTSWVTSPALGTEEFFEAFWGLAGEGKVTESGRPHALEGALLVRRFRREFRLVSPPALVQSLVFPVVATLARLLGRRLPEGSSSV